MISNAKILRIDRKTGIGADGEPIFTPGPTIAGGGCDCFLDDVTQSQRYELGSIIKTASQTVFIDKDDLKASGELPPGSAPDNRTGDRMLIQTEDGDQVSGEVVLVKDRVKAGMSHFECFIKKV